MWQHTIFRFLFATAHNLVPFSHSHLQYTGKSRYFSGIHNYQLTHNTPPKTNHHERIELSQEELSPVEGTRMTASLEYTLETLYHHHHHHRGAANQSSSTLLQGGGTRGLKALSSLLFPSILTVYYIFGVWTSCIILISII